MHKILTKLISRIKNEPFNLDKNIPFGYLLSIIRIRFVMLIRGLIVLNKVVYIGISSKIRCKKLFRIGKNVTIASNCYIDALSMKGIEMGDNVTIGKYTTIECSGTLKQLGVGLRVGSNVGLGSHGFLGCAGGVEIGDDTIFGNFVSVHSENHNYNDKDIPIRLQGINRQGIKIGQNCWIGAKVTILDGAHVEDGCIIAAGALLLAGRYHSNGVYGGVPAKLIKKRIYE